MTVSTSPVENDQSSNDSNHKPEAEQVPGENDTDNRETSPTESEDYPQESPESKESEPSGSRVEQSEGNGEGVGSEETVATKDNPVESTESVENAEDEKEETECCEGIMSFL